MNKDKKKTTKPILLIEKGIGKDRIQKSSQQLKVNTGGIKKQASLIHHTTWIPFLLYMKVMLRS